MKLFFLFILSLCYLDGSAQSKNAFYALDANMNQTVTGFFQIHIVDTSKGRQQLAMGLLQNMGTFGKIRIVCRS